MLLFAAIIFSPASLAQQNNTSFGIGYGPDYAGLGINFGFAQEDIFKYLAVGCSRPGYGGHYSCGGSVGFIQARPWGLSERFGMGVNIGLGYSQSEKYGTGSAVNIGATAGYYFSGVHSPGWHLAITPAVQFVGTKSSIVGLAGVGYQM